MSSDMMIYKVKALAKGISAIGLEDGKENEVSSAHLVACTALAEMICELCEQYEREEA